jgi:hypothetical protein
VTQVRGNLRAIHGTDEEALGDAAIWLSDPEGRRFFKFLTPQVLWIDFSYEFSLDS